MENAVRSAADCLRSVGAEGGFLSRVLPARRAPRKRSTALVRPGPVGETARSSISLSRACPTAWLQAWREKPCASSLTSARIGERPWVNRSSPAGDASRTTSWPPAARLDRFETETTRSPAARASRPKRRRVGAETRPESTTTALTPPAASLASLAEPIWASAGPSSTAQSGVAAAGAAGRASARGTPVARSDPVARSAAARINGAVRRCAGAAPGITLPISAVPPESPIRRKEGRRKTVLASFSCK
jgi:hypothetical protein